MLALNYKFKGKGLEFDTKSILFTQRDLILTNLKKTKARQMFIQRYYKHIIIFNYMFIHI